MLNFVSSKFVLFSACGIAVLVMVAILNSHLKGAIDGIFFQMGGLHSHPSLCS